MTPPTHDEPSKQKQKWATFTYSGPETSYITKLFKHTNLRIAYRTTNIQSYLHPNTHTKDIFTFVRCIRIDLPRLREGVCRADWSRSQDQVWRTQTGLHTQQPYIKLCSTPDRTFTHPWEHAKRHATSKLPKERHPPGHNRTISYTQTGGHKQSP